MFAFWDTTCRPTSVYICLTYNQEMMRLTTLSSSIASQYSFIDQKEICKRKSWPYTDFGAYNRILPISAVFP